MSLRALPPPARRLIAIVFIAVQPAMAGAEPTFDEVKAAARSSELRVLDASGAPLHRLRVDASVRRGDWVALADISPALRRAIVLSEDRRFYEHSGVDWQAVPAAAWANLWNTRTRGASTLSMQLAGLLDEDLRQRTGGRSLPQKIGQAISASGLDGRWKKHEILEAYLNLVPFRGEVVGIDALSRTLFGKAPSGLDEREAAVAAALVRAPNAAPARVSQRACGVWRALQAADAPAEVVTAGAASKAPDCGALDLFVTGALQRRAFDVSEGDAPHLARRLLTESTRIDAALSRQGGSAPADPVRTVRSTLRAPLQRFAVQTLQQHLRELRARHVQDGAVVVLDNASGGVLAWVGSSGELSQAGDVDGVTAPRQAGSTLKPFLYAQAIAQRRLTAASLLDDSPALIPTAGGLYIPQNYDRRFKGWVSVRTALGASLNVPAVRTLVMVSPDAFHRQLVSLGLPLRETGDYYGYSLALGSAEVSLLGLTNAYRALANGGRFGEVSLRPVASPVARGAPPATGRPPVIDPAAAFVVGDILSDPNARARTFGTDSVLATRFWTAVKTGTSKDMRDNWAVGWSQRYTVGVWVGNASGEPMREVSGTHGAAPVWAAVMQYLHAREPSRAPAAPAGLVQTATRFGDNLEAARDEWFLEGTQQPLFAINSGADYQALAGAGGGFDAKNPAAAASWRIRAPAPGTVFALDPDIPPQRQRVQLSASGGGAPAAGLRWRVNGRDVGRGASASWQPWPGRHALQLVAADGTALDELRIEVRGAGVRVGSLAGTAAK